MGGEHRFVWGPHADRIDGLATSCVDYLGRVTRALSGELGTERRYVTEKAEALRDAAQLLADACHDVAFEALRCGAEVVDIVDGMRVVDCRALPSAHDGDHNGRTPAAPVECAAGAARDLRDRVVALGDRLAWATHRRACDEDLGEIEADLLRVRSPLAKAAKAVEALRAEREGAAR